MTFSEIIQDVEELGSVMCYNEFNFDDLVFVQDKLLSVGLWSRYSTQNFIFYNSSFKGYLSSILKYSRFFNNLDKYFNIFGINYWPYEVGGIEKTLITPFNFNINKSVILINEKKTINTTT